MQAITNATQQELHIPEITIGTRLRLAREMCHLSQYELADIIGLSPRSVQNYERGNTEPKRPAVLAWAMATGVPMAWLTEDDFEPPPAPCPSCGVAPDLGEQSSPCMTETTQRPTLRVVRTG